MTKRRWKGKRAKIIPGLFDGVSSRLPRFNGCGWLMSVLSESPPCCSSFTVLYTACNVFKSTLSPYLNSAGKLYLSMHHIYDLKYGQTVCKTFKIDIDVQRNLYFMMTLFGGHISNQLVACQFITSIVTSFLFRSPKLVVFQLTFHLSCEVTKF